MTRHMQYKSADLGIRTADVLIDFGRTSDGGVPSNALVVWRSPTKTISLSVTQPTEEVRSTREDCVKNSRDNQQTNGT